MRRKLLHLLIIAAVIIGGYALMNKYQQDKLIEEAQKKAPIILKKNFKDIHTVGVSEENHQFYPKDLGGLAIGGYINNNPDLFFQIDFKYEGRELGKVTSFVIGGHFPEKKKECEKRICQ